MTIEYDDSFTASMSQSWFQSRTAVLGTRHRKEEAIAPLLLSVGVTVVVPPNFNSDRFGTFTRDVERKGNQLEAARWKAKAALDELGGTLAIASEGAFYPHPSMPMLPCNREVVLLLDTEHDLEIVGETLSTNTNYAHRRVASVDDAIAFAERAGFPEHGLVVMLDETAATEDMEKGIRERDRLVASVEQMLARSMTGTVHIETDMRAMHNPMRMQAIAAATQDLVQKLQTYCPACGVPGFSVVQRLPGLPCAACQLPTPLIRSEVYQCQKCQHRQEQMIQQRPTADPMHCPFCNP
jgi:hypothetical protein